MGTNNILFFSRPAFNQNNMLAEKKSLIYHYLFFTWWARGNATF